MFKKSNLITIIIVAITSFVIGITLTINLDIGDSSIASDSLWKESQKETVLKPVVGGLPTLSTLARDLSPTVVNISTTQVIKQQRRSGREFNNPLFDDFFGDDFFKFFDEPKNGEEREYKKQSLGSGFIINEDGYIITNFHVIENASEIIVTLSGETKKEYEAKLIGKDKKTDLALIKIEPKHSLTVATLGDSDKLNIGDWVMAIGNPFGLGGTVTAGIVSQKGRVIGAGPYDDFIQTDASINPGNSGGPLFDLKGEVIGINTAIISGGQGIGFAVPVNMAKEIIGQLKENGKVTRGWIGVAIQEVTPALAKSLKLDEASGVLITSVMEGDPAEKAGIKRRDVIVEFNGKKIIEVNDLPRAVAAVKPGKKAEVVVIRDGKKKTFSLEVARKKDGEEKEESSEKEEKENKVDKLGIIVHGISSSVAERFGLDSATGVFVSSVKVGSPASEAGITKMDIILEVNGSVVTSSKDYEKLVNKALKNDVVELLVKRGRVNLYIAISLDD